MTIYLINNNPYTAVLNGFEPIDYLTYHSLIESGEIDDMEVIEL